MSGLSSTNGGLSILNKGLSYLDGGLSNINTGLSFVNTSTTGAGFIFTINTENLSTGSSNDDQFCLPLHSVGTYNFDVDWGDGNVDTITTWNQSEVTHTYDTPGTYEIRIVGTCTGWAFFDNGDGLPIDNNKTLNISQWGDLILSDDPALDSYFYNCANLTITATDILNLIPTQSMLSAFEGCSSLTTIPSIASWNWSNITTASRCFTQCFLVNQSFNGADFSNITDLSDFLSSAQAYNQTISWNIPSATTLTNCFASTNSLNQSITLTTSSALTDLSYLLSDNAIFNSAISISDTSGTINYDGMLGGCSSLDQDLSDLSWASAASAAGMLVGVTLSTTNYDALLNSIDGQPHQSNVVFDGGNSQYTSAGEPARDALVLDGWTITDGGLI